MAEVVASTQFDITDLDLNLYYSNLDDSELKKNVNASFAGTVYPDIFTIEASPGSEKLVLTAAGSGIVFNGVQITAGTINAVGETNAKTGMINWYAKGLSLSASALYNATVSASTNDDQALIQSAFSGADTIVLSAFADRMNGYSGDDVITGGGGNDVLDGGQGSDTAVYSGSFANASITFQGATLQITMPGEGTDTLTNFEFLRFGNDIRSVANLSDSTPPTVTTFSPTDGATQVAASSNIVITFSEAIQKGAGAIAIRAGSANGAVFEQFDVTTSARLNVTGSTLTIDPTSDLAANTTYFVTFEPNAINDLVGNAFVGPTNYDFKTAPAAVIPASDDWNLLASTGFVGEIGGSGQIFGTIGFQDISVLNTAGSVTLDNSFNQGGDIVRLEGAANSWKVTLSESNAILSDGDTFLTVPIGINGLGIKFADGVRSLRFDRGAGVAKIGSQTIDGSSTTISSLPDGTLLPTGAVPEAKANLYLAIDGEVIAGGNLEVFGTKGNESVELTYGDISLDVSFNKGGDAVTLNGAATTFSGQLSESSVILSSSALDVQLPVGIAGLDIAFDGSVRELIYIPASQEVRLGMQQITPDVAPLTIG